MYDPLQFNMKRAVWMSLNNGGATGAETISPSPRAFPMMSNLNDSIVLFGGFEHSELLPADNDSESVIVNA